MTEEKVEVQAGVLLRKCGLRLATAESCTGGLIGHKITSVSGSSDYYVGGVISYANEVKVKLLGVRRETLEAFGAVSRETVLEMAVGVRLVLDSDIGLAVSGIAGPGGGSLQKPVGTVWIGLSTPNLDHDRLFHFSGDRAEVKEQAADQALYLLCEYLQKKSNESGAG